ncbi:hypothetical protein D4764_03G0008370 [Takifugu flavidus]|uniref:Uncharacterized protein n=1 Tax=Takifugu flavidus TaxID=433684 RepID=A0A5C6NAD8_9TELE|nr:hypothetical protein D4764_03G0008370 [Takifugu flavidus]
MQSKAERKRSECVRVTEVSGERENVEMVVEVTGESGEAGDGMSEISELGDAGEMGDTGQTGEQGVAVGEVGQETVERGAPGKMAGELGEGGMTTGEQGEVNVSTGELGEVSAGTSEDAAAATDTSDQEYTSDGSELSNMAVDSERDDLYPISMIKSFLRQTKGMRGPDLGVYVPDSHWIKHRAASDLTDPEIFRLKKHMGKTRKQLRELSNESTSL